MGVPGLGMWARWAQPLDDLWVKCNFSILCLTRRLACPVHAAYGVVGRGVVGRGVVGCGWWLGLVVGGWGHRCWYGCGGFSVGR